MRYNYWTLERQRATVHGACKGMAGAANMVRAGAKNQPQDAIHLVHIRYLGRTTPRAATFQAVVCRSWSKEGYSESNLEDTVNYWAAWMLVPVSIFIFLFVKITLGDTQVKLAFISLLNISASSCTLIVELSVFKKMSLPSSPRTIVLLQRRALASRAKGASRSV